MAEDIGRASEEQRARRRATDATGRSVDTEERQSNRGDASHYSAELLGDMRLGNRGNSSVRTSVMHDMQRTHGNRAVQRALQSSTSVQRFEEPTPWRNRAPFVEPAPWAGQGGRQSGWNGMPSGPNLGVAPAGPGAGWMSSPGSPMPQIDNPAFPGGGPFFNPTPQIDNPAFPGGGPFFNPTPQIDNPVPGGWAQSPQPGVGGDDPAFFPFYNPTFDFPSGSQIGSEPQKGVPGPFAYFKDNGKKGFDRGLEGGFAAFHGEDKIGGVPVTDDLLYGGMKMGGWDNGQGGMRYGYGANAGVAKMSVNNGGFISGDAEALTASAEASVGNDGATLGAQATLVGGSVTLGGDPTKASDQDESVRLGLSEGIGLAGRLHWGDKDGDKNREYGFGADFGPFSFDLKSEDPLRTLVGTATGPLGNALLGSGNATNAAVDYASQGWNAAKDLAGSGYDTVSSGLGGAYDAVSSYLPW